MNGSPAPQQESDASGEGCGVESGVVEQLPLAVLEADLIALASDLAAAECRFLLMIAEFDRREGWAGHGVVSCAHWLSWRCGLSLATARDRVRVARALTELPKVVASFAKGELSYARARAIVRVATPENETALVETARHSTGAQLERICRGTKTAQMSQDESPSAPSRRSVSFHWDDDGMLVLRARLDADEGAAVIAALEAARAADWNDRAERKADDTADDTADAASGGGGHEAVGTPVVIVHDSTDRRTCAMADALVSVAETYVAGQRAAAGADIYQVVVHVQDGAGCFLEGGPGLDRPTALRLLCDAALYCVHKDAAGNVLDIGRSTRRIPAAMRKALWLRDGGCRFPGCGRRRRVDGHHVEHWADGGSTALRNLVLLCRRHHRAIHRQGFSVVMFPDGQPRFVHPDGSTMPEVPVTPPSSGDPRRWHGSLVAPAAVDTRWSGERVDIDYVASVLGGRREPPKRDLPDDPGSADAA